MKRGLPSSCTYLSSNGPSQQAKRHPPSNTSVQDRINHLENLVVKLMESSGQAGPGLQNDSAVKSDTSPPNPPSAAASSAEGNSPKPTSNAESHGVLSVGEAETSYFGSDHWKAILDEITELKNCTGDDRSDRSKFPGPELLLGHRKNVTLDEIIAALPPKSVIDLSIDRFFTTLEMASGEYIILCLKFPKMTHCEYSRPPRSNIP